MTTSPEISIKSLAKSLFHASAFVNTLPDDVSIPDVSLDQDKDVEMEWYSGRPYVVTVWFSPNGTIGYAALIGENSSHGTTTAEQGIEKILTLIRQLPK